MRRSVAIRNEEDWERFKMGFGSGKIHIGAPKRYPFITLAHSPGDPNCIHYVFVYEDEFRQQTVFPAQGMRQMDFLQLPFATGCAVCDSQAKVIATEWGPQDGIPLCNKCKKKFRDKTLDDVKAAIEAKKCPS